MGNAYSVPNFKDLIETVMFLIMHCSTSTLNDSVPVEKRPKTPEHYDWLINLDQSIISDLILNPEFLRIAAKNATDYIGYGFAHLSFGNQLVSRIVAD